MRRANLSWNAKTLSLPWVVSCHWFQSVVSIYMGDGVTSLYWEPSVCYSILRLFPRVTLCWLLPHKMFNRFLFILVFICLKINESLVMITFIKFSYIVLIYNFYLSVSIQIEGFLWFNRLFVYTIHFNRLI